MMNIRCMTRTDIDFALSLTSKERWSSTRTDFEQLITLEAQYDYEEYMQTTMTVKSSGEAASE